MEQESAQLILQSGAMGSGGEIFVLDMGEPVNIKDIAYELIRLNGLEPEKDIFIDYIGPRKGEKLREELRFSDERVVKTEHNKILMMKNLKVQEWENYLNAVNKLILSAKSYNFELILKEISKCVPNFIPDLNKSYPKISNSFLREI